MANGDILGSTSSGAIGSRSETIALIDAAVGDVDGPWHHNEENKGGSIEITGIASSAHVQIFGTNSNDPDDSVDGTQIGADVTANGWVYLTNSYRFIKAKVISASAPLTGLSVVYHAVSP